MSIKPLDIIHAVEQEYHLPKGRIFKHCRKRQTALARATSQYLIRSLTPLSWHEIAEIYKHDHTSIIYNCKRIAKSVDESPSSNLHDVIIAVKNMLEYKI